MAAPTAVRGPILLYSRLSKIVTEVLSLEQQYWLNLNVVLDNVHNPLLHAFNTFLFCFGLFLQLISTNVDLNDIILLKTLGRGGVVWPM